MQAIFDAHQGPPRPSHENTSHTNNMARHNTRTIPDPTSTNTIARIPRRRLEPLKFSGNIVAYRSWRNWFFATHDTPDLTDAEKGQYVMGLVEEEAWETISGFELHQFHAMINALDERYNRPDLVQNHLLHTAANITFTNLNTFITKIQKVIRSKSE